MNSSLVGITERGDAALDTSWLKKYQEGMKMILITKNPHALFDFVTANISDTSRMIVHTSITGLGGSVLEPNVPYAARSFEYYLKFVNLLGHDRVVLRIDPIIPESFYLDYAKGIFQKYLDAGTPSRLRISFMDNYPHVKERWKELGLEEISYHFHAPLEKRLKLWEEFDSCEICGEPGFEKVASGCISERDLDVLSIEDFVLPVYKQRDGCKCLNKQELLNNKSRCAHGCAYCYWKN